MEIQSSSRMETKYLLLWILLLTYFVQICHAQATESAVEGNGGNTLDEVPTAMITIVVLGVCIAVGIGIAKGFDHCHDRRAIRDDASDISDFTKDLLKAQFMFAFNKRLIGKIKAKETVKQRARRMGRMWVAKARHSLQKRKLEEQRQNEMEDGGLVQVITVRNVEISKIEDDNEIKKNDVKYKPQNAKDKNKVDTKSNENKKKASDKMKDADYKFDDDKLTNNGYHEKRPNPVEKHNEVSPTPTSPETVQTVISIDTDSDLEESPKPRNKHKLKAKPKTKEKAKKLSPRRGPKDLKKKAKVSDKTASVMTPRSTTSDERNSPDKDSDENTNNNSGQQSPLDTSLTISPREEDTQPPTAREEAPASSDNKQDPPDPDLDSRGRSPLQRQFMTYRGESDDLMIPTKVANKDAKSPGLIKSEKAKVSKESDDDEFDIS